MLQPAILFAGERFESNPQFALARSLLLDFFRGLQVSTINLAGLDRVIMATAASDDTVLLRQYAIRLKKWGTKVGVADGPFPTGHCTCWHCTSCTWWHYEQQHNDTERFKAA